MRKVNDWLKEEMKKDPDFKKLHDLAIQKAEVGKKIIKYRIDHNLTQAALAKKIGVTQQYVSKIEDGNFSNFDSTIDILNKIGYAIQIKVVPLLHRKHA